MSAKRKTKGPTLFDVGEPEQAKADVKRWIDAYHDAFVEKWGRSPIIFGGKNGNQAKQLIKAVGSIDEALAIIKEFFASTDVRITRTDYSIGAIVTNAQYLRVSGKQVDRRTAAALSMVKRLSGRQS